MKQEDFLYWVYQPSDPDLPYTALGYQLIGWSMSRLRGVLHDADRHVIRQQGEDILEQVVLEAWESLARDGVVAPVRRPECPLTEEPMYSEVRNYLFQGMRWRTFTAVNRIKRERDVINKIGFTVGTPEPQEPPESPDLLPGVARHIEHYLDRYALGLRYVLTALDTPGKREYLCEPAELPLVIEYLKDMLLACKQRTFFSRIRPLGHNDSGPFHFELNNQLWNQWKQRHRRKDYLYRSFRNVMLRAMAQAYQDNPQLLQVAGGGHLNAQRAAAGSGYSVLEKQAKLLTSQAPLPALAPAGRIPGGQSAASMFIQEWVEVWTSLCGGRTNVGRIGEWLARRPGTLIDTPFPPPWPLERP